MSLFNTGFLKTIRDLTARYYPENNVLWDDDFINGFNGWVPLWDAGDGQRGMLSLSPLSQTGQFSLQLATGNVPNTEQFGTCLAIKRMSRVKSSGVFNFECWAAYGSRIGEVTNTEFKTPRSFEFGVDTALPDGNFDRRFFRVRFWNYDDSTDTYPKKWQVRTQNGWEDIPGADYFFPWNDAKPTYLHIRLSIDFDTYNWHELQVLDETYDLTGFDKPPTNSAGGFAGGLNGTIEIVNPSINADADSESASFLLIDRTRGYYS